MFQILFIANSESASAERFATADEANKAAAKIREATGQRTRIQRIVTTAWRDREATRMKDGTYTALPAWFLQRSFFRYSEIALDHFAHLSTDGARIAFTESAMKGEADMQTVLAPTRYLARYFKDSLTESEIHDIGQAFCVDNFAMQTGATRAEFRRAYDSQPLCAESSDYPSCMAGAARDYGSNNHPAEAYAGGDLSIAWLAKPAEESAILARAVIWPEKKAFVRVYGLKESHKIILIRKLTDAGYTREKSFSGARLARIEHPHGVLMPYIDGSQSVADYGNCLKIERGGVMRCDSTQGYAYTDSGCDDDDDDDDDTTECDRCGRRVDSDDTQSVSGNTWCDRCAERYSMYCEHYSEQRDSDDGCNTVNVRRGSRSHYSSESQETWCDDAVSNDAFHCERTDEYYCDSGFTRIQVNMRDGSTEYWAICEETEGEFFECAVCGDYFEGSGHGEYSDICDHCHESGFAAELAESIARGAANQRRGISAFVVALRGALG